MCKRSFIVGPIETVLETVTSSFNSDGFLAWSGISLFNLHIYSVFQKPYFYSHCPLCIFFFEFSKFTEHKILYIMMMISFWLLYFPQLTVIGTVNCRYFCVIKNLINKKCWISFIIMFLHIDTLMSLEISLGKGSCTNGTAMGKVTSKCVTEHQNVTTSNETRDSSPF